MSASIRQRKALHLVADTRTAGQRRADAAAWAHPEHRPLTQRRRRDDKRTGMVPAAWALIALWTLVIAGLWVLSQPWFLAWRDL